MYSAREKEQGMSWVLAAIEGTAIAANEGISV